MPDDETLCGETLADIRLHQIRLLERRVKELTAESELRGRQLEVETRAYKMLSDRLVEVETGRALAEAELTALNAEECEECESTLGDLMKAAHPSVATWFCLKCWNAAIGKATTAERERCARAIEALAVDPNRDEREYVNTILAYAVAAVRRPGSGGAAK